MATSTVKYLGQLRCEATHQASGNQMITDAPTDNHGKGEAFSPTDTVATALATCMLTIMGIASKEHGFDLDGATAQVEKIMASDPRRISQINIDLDLTMHNYTDSQKRVIEHISKTCPVAMSLDPKLVQNVNVRFS